VLIPTGAGLFALTHALRKQKVAFWQWILVGLILIEGLGSYFVTKPFTDRGALVRSPAVLRILDEQSTGIVPERLYSLMPLAEQYGNIVAPFPNDKKTKSAFL